MPPRRNFEADDYEVIVGAVPAGSGKKAKTGIGLQSGSDASDAFMTEAVLNSITHPSIKAFLDIKALTRANYFLLDRAVMDYELHTDEMLLEGTDCHTSAYAPFHIVVSLGLAIYSCQLLELQAETTRETKIKIANMEKSLAALREANQNVVTDPTNIRAITTALFYNPHSPGYSVGDPDNPGPSRQVENAVMKWLAKDPTLIGSNGPHLMKRGNVDGEKVVRTHLKDKLDGLRSRTKTELWKSLGVEDESKQITLLEIASTLLGHARLEVTPAALKRLAFLQSQAKSKKVYKQTGVVDDDGNRVMEANRDFWAQVDANVAKLNQDLADPVSRHKAEAVLQNLYEQDQNEYGEFDFDLDEDAHFPDEFKISQFLKAFLAPASLRPSTEGT
ncbi:unnamed protein product [Tilletia laevis]|uniref:Uncharacterized protein n=2 Tax=Tilletia TaxID=13289 RepID=A0A9N8M2W5_9BASI|nr:hypothetical protein CF335_g3400 [Tilletia laevis]KAE8263842.1 hypothetical protein A4X03_0g1384 [Tilletia caries]CAD6884627.1 unnamed protein product [Tilletia caries]CAD6936844.1 unnamed protein product [Tilletia laevis]CAD6946645.1 unnamed protein product [Tilletia caries]